MRLADAPHFARFEAVFFDRQRHREALAGLAAEALKARRPFEAYGFAHRLCAVPAPKSRDILLRGLALDALGEKLPARADFARALEIDPTDGFVLNVLAACADAELRDAAERLLRGIGVVEAAPAPRRAPQAATRREIDSSAGLITVIVPVHGAPEATSACLLALYKDGSKRLRRIVVVDDASPQPELRAWLDAQAARRRIVLLRNETNLGFAASVNRALAICDEGDALLLNSDALLPAGAIDALAEAAHANDAVGTLTPLSNNGEWTSFPEPFQLNPLPSPERIEILMRAARDANRTGVVDLPNGVGFCLYITRRCLDAVPRLPELYGRGYSEDAEYGLLAREAGLRNVCATGVYVGHEGSRSFRGEKRALALRNLATLQSRFPDHAMECAAFLAADPLRLARARLAALAPANPLAANSARTTASPSCLPASAPGGALGVWLPSASADAERLLLRLARSARTRWRGSIVVFGRGFDDLALMTTGNLFVAGALAESEAPSVALRFGVGAWLSPGPNDSTAAFRIARATGRAIACFAKSPTLETSAGDLLLRHDLSEAEVAARCLDWLDNSVWEKAA